MPFAHEHEGKGQDSAVSRCHYFCGVSPSLSSTSLMSQLLRTVGLQRPLMGNYLLLQSDYS